MFSNIKTAFQDRIQKIYRSIAFYPAAIGILFLVISYFTIEFDFSPAGKNLKAGLSWLSLKDAATARSIISSIVSGIISLTVFSFSMVMIVLNQAASNMSNRVLDKLIGNRFQQVVLGIYIGTIVYALFLLSTIRDIDSASYIPAISTYLLILLTILDIFLFIYFIHYITQSVKYGVVIQRIYESTQESLHQNCLLTEAPVETPPSTFDWTCLKTTASGIYEGFNTSAMRKFCTREAIQINLTVLPGDFLLAGTAIGSINKEISSALQERLLQHFRIHDSETIEGNYFYGFKQLMEVALKALSPGINDPDTAVIALRALFRLYGFRLMQFPQKVLYDEAGKVLVFAENLSFRKIFEETVLPVWDYGREDRIVGRELQILLKQLYDLYHNAEVGHLLAEVSATRVK